MNAGNRQKETPGRCEEGCADQQSRSHSSRGETHVTGSPAGFVIPVLHGGPAGVPKEAIFL